MLERLTHWLTKKGSKPLLVQLAKDALTEATSMKSGVADGKISIQNKPPVSYFSLLLQQAKNSAQEISVADPQTWWLTSEGLKYHQENITRAKNGLNIERVFTFGSHEEALQLQPIILEQLESGIHLWATFLGEKTSYFARHFLLIDNRYAAQLHFQGRKCISSIDIGTDDWLTFEYFPQIFLSMKEIATRVNRMEDFDRYLEKARHLI